jgi:RimJ/RimL family protein N-acetyltransferase
MKLKVLSLADLEQVRLWRNESLSALRTPFLLTAEMQEKFYRDVICSRQAGARYWGVWKQPPVTRGIVVFDDERLVGMCGLENISWENHRAEISIILNPEHQGKGHGEKAVGLLLDQGFNYLNLDNIWGECYTCNPAVDFWGKVTKKYKGSWVTIPNTKYYSGKYWDSVFFNVTKEDYREHENTLPQPTQAPD